MHRLPLKPDFPVIRGDRTRNRLDQRRLAGAVIPDHGKDLAGIEIEIGLIERRDTAVTFDEPAGGEDRFLGHQPATFLIH